MTSAAGKLSKRLVAYTNAPWADAITLLDAAGEPVAIEGPINIGLRSLRAATGYSFLVRADEITIVGNVADWRVPKDRMSTVPPDAYQLEITMGPDSSRLIMIEGEIEVRAGINP